MKSILITALFTLIILPVQAATLKPDATIGNVQLKSPTARSITALPEFSLVTGSKTKTVTTPALSHFLGIKQAEHFLSRYGLQGSAAQFNVRRGTYEITWQFETIETDGDDLFLIWNGATMNTIASSSIAIVRSGTKRVSYWQKTKIETLGELDFIAVDTRDRVNQSTIEVYDIQRTPEGTSTIAFLVPLLVLIRRKSHT